MPRLHLTSHLRRFFPGLGEAADGAPVVDIGSGAAPMTVADLIRELDRRHKGLAGYLIDDRGALRKHVNIFIGTARVRDRENLLDAVGADDEVFVLQALSGG